MRRDPALTYRGALRLLGKGDHRILDALDALVGGLILASPVTPLAAAWGWIEQKSEALSLVRQLLDIGSKRILKTRSYERYQLITAAHTVIVVAAFFDSLRDELGKGVYKKLALTDREKALLAEGQVFQSGAQDLIDILSSAEISLPSPVDGFAESGPFLREYYDRMFGSVMDFVRGLDAWKSVERLLQNRRRDPLAHVPQAAVTRYRSYFIDLAGAVPEFHLWALLSEGRATRQLLIGNQDELREAILGQVESLGRLENILTCLGASSIEQSTRCREIMSRANRSALSDTVIPISSIDQVDQITLPTVERIYQSPRFRTARYDAGAKPSDDGWWAGRALLGEIDVFFAAYFASPESVSTPLLLLGHPGAGKSLLTKVLAARLPTGTYTAVRVPLRRVDADAPVYQQIQQAIDIATNHRVNWADLVEEGERTTRVVFLDGLDELLQASTNSRASYLQEVAEFQRREADQERPVAFVVTSRTVVADRVRILPDMTMAKLDDFDRDQVVNWLRIWRNHNEEHIATKKILELPAKVALKHYELTRQPLLLLMLALYAADPNADRLDARLSSADFYGRILNGFVRREVSKIERALLGNDIAGEVEDQLWRLGIAGFAMFNRDRQDISDHELGADIVALTNATSPDGQIASVGQATISRFFFVHTAEANAHRDTETQRAYEFLHATFGEYLVAHYTVKVLAEMADNPRPARRGGREFDDDLFFALLSQQTIATRRSIVVFVKELLVELPDESRQSCERALETLFNTYRSRAGTNVYAAYRPLSIDHARDLAAYSANLVLLRTIMADSRGVDLGKLAGRDFSRWTSTIGLWRASLGGTGWDAICRALDVTRGSEVIERTRELPSYGLELGFAQLTQDWDLLVRYQYGLAIEGRRVPVGTGFRGTDLVTYLLGVTGIDGEPGDTIRSTISELASGRTRSDDAAVDDKLLGGIEFRAIVGYLAKHGPKLDYSEVEVLIRVALQHKGEDCSALIPSVATYPALLTDIPQLRQPELYRQDWVVLVLLSAELAPRQSHAEELRALRESIESQIDIAPRWTTSRDAIMIMIRKQYRVSEAVDRKWRATE